MQASTTPAPAVVAAPPAQQVPAPAPTPAGPTPVQAQYPNSSLYVGDLAPTTTEAELFQHFREAGGVMSVRICRHAVTRQSLGYGYVNFNNQEDAQTAITELNYSEINKQPCRIMWSQRDPSQRKSSSNNIFVKNLEKSIDQQQLHDTFEQFGTVLSSKIGINERTGESKGFGFVHYQDKAAADLAIEKVNGMVIKGMKVYVGRFMPKKERDAEIAAVRAKFTNVYVKNLPKEKSDEDFRKMCEEHGEVSSCVVMRDEESGASKGFGFVDFADHEGAARAVEALHETANADGTTLFVSRAQKKMEREADLKEKFEMMKLKRQSKYQGTNLYIKNLDDNIDLERLRKEFDPYGTITSAKIAMSEDKSTSRGFGFVCYSSPDEATKAVNEMHGRIIEKKPLYVGLAESKEQRKMKLESERATLKHSPVPMANMMAGQMYPGMQNQMYMRQPMMGQMPLGPMRPNQQAQQQPPRWGMQPSQQYRGAPMQPQPGRQPQNPPRNNGQSRQPRTQGVPPHQGQQPQRAPQQGRPVPQGIVPNKPGPAQAPVGGAMAAQQQQPPKQLSLADQILSLAPSEQKVQIGGHLYRHVEKVYPEQAPKLTGMLLEMDINAIIALLNGCTNGQIGDELKARLDEAKEVLDTAQAAAAAATVAAQ